jgi:hypothetical protein
MGSGWCHAHDEVMRLGVAVDVRSDIRTGRDHLQTPPPCVVEREPHELLGDASTLMCGQHLGMDQRDPVLLRLVVDEASKVALDPCLISLAGLGIDERRSHSTDGTGCATAQWSQPSLGALPRPTCPCRAARLVDR